MKTIFRRRPVWAVCLLTVAGICAAVAQPVGNAERAPLRKAVPAAPAETAARVIVKYKADSVLMRALSATGGAGAPPQHARELGGRLGLALTDGRTIGARAQVLTGNGLSSQALAELLAAQSDVEYAVVDGRMHALALPSDPLYPNNLSTATPAAGQWYLRAPTSNTIVDATSVLSAINAEAAWNVTTGSAGIVVATLDTGVRKDHPDLAAKLLAGYDFVSASISNDGTGADADASDPGDNTGTDASSWHGTQTAGLIGASTNDGIGMASVSRDVMVLPVRVLGTGGGFDSDIQAGMLWAAGLSSTPVVNPNPAKVINMSLGASGACSAAYLDVVQQLNAAGVVVVAAAGNDGLAVGTPANCQGTTSAGVAYGVIAVAGIRHAGTKVGYSDLGPQIAIAAPAGNCVNATGACLFPLLTTSNRGTTTPVADANGGSIYTGGGDDASLGTSFSAPLVAGTVGLMLSANPSLTPAQVLSFLKSGARPFPVSGAGAGVAACTAPSAIAQGSECYCTTSTCGAGMLDAAASVALAAAGVPVANINTSTTPQVGSPLSLSGAASKGSAEGAPVQSYAWSIVSGASIATFAGAINASTATLVGNAPGAVVVGLTVTDSAGKTATTRTTLTVVTPTTATISPSSSSVVVGGSIALDGSASHASLGSIVSYQWAITGGSSLASLSGATNASTATLLTTATGNVTVSLSVTDIVGKTATSSQTLTVDPVPSSGGGGAMSLGWLFAWLAAVIAVGVVTPRARRR